MGTDSSSPPRRSSFMDATFSCTKPLSAILQSVPLCHSRSKRTKKASRKRATFKEQGLEENHRKAKVARGKAKERMERKEKIARIRMKRGKRGKVTKRTKWIYLSNRQFQLHRCHQQRPTATHLWAIQGSFLLTVEC